VSVLESEVSDLVEVDAVSDKIRRWSNLSEGEYQRFVSVEDFFNSPDSPVHLLSLEKRWTHTNQTFWTEDEFTVTTSSGIVIFDHRRRRDKCVLDTSGC
jgi:hypothetical protein